jgi:hypothetical protein
MPQREQAHHHQAAGEEILVPAYLPRNSAANYKTAEVALKKLPTGSRKDIFLKIA